MSALDAALGWLSRFSSSIATNNAPDVASLLLWDGWLRDVLVLTWNTRSLSGNEKISAYLSEHLSKARLSNFHLDQRPGLEPQFYPLDPNAVELAFTFESALAHGRGAARILDRKGAGEWKALYIYLMVDNLKGHEEHGPDVGVYGGHTIPWEAIRDQRRVNAEQNPYAVICRSFTVWVYCIPLNRKCQWALVRADCKSRRVSSKWTSQLSLSTKMPESEISGGDATQRCRCTPQNHTVPVRTLALMQFNAANRGCSPIPTLPRQLASVHT